MPSEQEREPETHLQGVLLGLVRFWTEEGCLLLPPCDFEVSAGTLHPESFFHLLDPDPWRATYLQPVRRPLDGRRRGHPFRFLKHLQLQVVLKPGPPDVQDLYLRSLEAVGCRLEVHDLRFAEWCWESAALDAWGSGWHVLVDGLGVTRLTFLQRAAGRDLEPVAVELSYGVERLAMLLGDLPSADAVPWRAGGPTYGELRRREETELSRYVFEVVRPEDARRSLEALALEADRCLDSGLARPAYERSLKALAEIDLLEARGELGVSEREPLVTRIRHQVAAAAVLCLAELRATTGASPVADESDGPEGAPADDGDGEPPAEKGGKKRAAKPRRSRRRASRGASDGG